MTEGDIKVINKFVVDSGLKLYPEYREHIIYLILVSYLKSKGYEINETFTWLEFNNYKRGYTLPIKKQNYIVIDKIYTCLSKYFDKADVQLLWQCSFAFPEDNKDKTSGDEFYKYCRDIVDSKNVKELLDRLRHTCGSSARLYIFLFAVDVLYTKFGIEVCKWNDFRYGWLSFDTFYKRIEDGAIYGDVIGSCDILASKSGVANRYQKYLILRFYEHLNSSTGNGAMDKLWNGLDSIADKLNDDNIDILDYVDDLLSLFYTVDKQENRYTVMLFTFQRDECKSVGINVIDEFIRKLLKCVEAEYGIIIEYKERDVGVQLKLEKIAMYREVFDFSDYVFIEEKEFQPAMIIRITYDFKVILDGQVYSKDVELINELISNRGMRPDKSILCAYMVIHKACRDEGSYDYRSSFIKAMFYLYELYSKYNNVCILNTLREIQINEDDSARITELGNIRFKFWENDFPNYHLVQLNDDEAIEWFHAIQELELLYKKVEDKNYVIKEPRKVLNKLAEKALLWYKDIREVLLGTLPFLLGVISGASTKMIIILLVVGLIFTRSVMKFDNFRVYNLVSAIRSKRYKR